MIDKITHSDQAGQRLFTLEDLGEESKRPEHPSEVREPLLSGRQYGDKNEETNDVKMRLHGLSERMGILEETLVRREAEIAGLTGKVAGLTDEVAELKGELYNYIQAAIEEHNLNVAEKKEYEGRFQKILKALKVNPTDLFHRRVKMFLEDHEETKEYFYALYWWLVVVFQAFRFGQTGINDMNLDMFSKRSRVILKKTFKCLLKSLEIGTSSLQGGQAASLMSWVYESVIKRHEAKKQEKMSDKIANITRDVLYDSEFQIICIKTAMRVIEKLDIKAIENSLLEQRQELNFIKKIKFSLGIGGFQRDLILYNLESRFKDFQVRFAIYHTIALIKYLYESGKPIDEGISLEDVFSEAIINESWINRRRA